MVVAPIHARLRDGAHFLVTQLGSREAAALGLLTDELFILVRRDEIAGNAAMTAHRHGLALRQHAVAPEIVGEL